MTPGKFVTPNTSLTAFNCPWCHAYARFVWHATMKLALVAADRITQPRPGHSRGTVSGGSIVEKVWISTCSHCQKEAIWVDNGSIYPPTQKIGPTVDVDMPEDIVRDYEEARSIAQNSPRGAAALLRLCLQKLCVKLGEPGENINHDIGSLVTKGLPAQVQQALDTVRVFGNNAVHPGELDLKDDVGTVLALMDMVNYISERMIGQPKRIEQLFGKVPAGAKASIEKRDS